MEDGVLDSNFGCPSGKALSFSAKGDDMILACIASLLAASSPVAVVFEIPKTAIASFDAMRTAMQLQRPGCLHFSTLAIGGPI